MLITTEDLKQYTICPMLLKHKYPLRKDPFLLALKQALTYLYAFEMSNNKKVTSRSMMSKWDKIWGQEDRAVHGWMIIKKFMDKVYNKDKRIPHLVNLDYKSQVGPIHIATHFDVILSDNLGNLTLLEFGLATNHMHLQLQLDADIEAKTKLLILHKSLDNHTCTLIRYNLNEHLSSAKIITNNQFVTSTEKIIRGIINNIHNELFYPVPTCKCPHPKKCKNGD